MKDNAYISKDETPKQEKKKRFKKKRIRSASSKNPGKSSQTLVQIMNGDFLTKEFVLNNLAFIFFFIFLLILMVSKGYYVNQLASDIKRTEEEVGQITADYVETKAKLEEETRRTELIKKLEPIGLKETINPTKVIRIKKESE
jgi:hypothetical protein